jgi:hypothetical protein
MNIKTAIVVTSISAPNRALRALARDSSERGYDLVIVGDVKSPVRFTLEGARFFSIGSQLDTEFEFAHRCPTHHYARKNMGYLIAIRDGAGLILETDDDNRPWTPFYAPRKRNVCAPRLDGRGWINVYRYFSESLIWPRGFPLEHVHDPPPPFEALPVTQADCPIQQGLADANPDVDAIYRLLLPLPQMFRTDRSVILGHGTWCPFNSQNTAWWPEAYPLLYLPAYCPFRMTDIWRSFVAQRIVWENNWAVLFRAPDVTQERNEHSLMADFRDEVTGYLNNGKICQALEELTLRPGIDSILDNMRLCYETLVEMNVVGEQELPLLETWLADLTRLFHKLTAETQRAQRK